MILSRATTHLNPALVVPPVKLSTVGSRAFEVAAPHIWNTLPTDVVAASLVYRTETTTKKCKTEKVQTDVLRSNRKSLGNHVVSREEEKERLQWEGFAEKECFKSRMKESG